VLLGLAGCITPKPPTKYARTLTIAVALVRDDVHKRVSHAVPQRLASEVRRELEVRNLRADILQPTAFVPQFTATLDTDRRLSHLAHEGKPDAVLLVETQALFYSQIGGMFRWTVYAKVSVAERGASRAALSRQYELPITLTYGHEAENEALDAAAGEIARLAAAVLDTYLGDPARATPASSPTSASGIGDSVYMVLVDRFFNGEPSNDGKVDREDPAAWHGGDLRGVIRQLDYLHNLGVSTIWLSPVFRTRYEPFMGHGAFHGYWVHDLRAVDPRFGTAEDLRELAQALHTRGMRLLLDFVVNHVGYEAPLLKEHPEWFHNKGTIRNWNDPEEVVTHEVHGLPDLAQERPEVFEYLLGAADHWIAWAGVDGLRLDAVKHVSLDFWSAFNTKLLRRYPHLVLLGELFEGAPEIVERYQREGAFTHMFDFPSAFALRDVFCGGRPAGRLASVISSRRLHPDPARLVTFVDNHDMPRIHTVCQGDDSRVAAALTAQFALEGIPSLTYGIESGLTGGAEPFNRPDMVFDPPNRRELKAHIAQLLRLRRQHRAFSEGTTRILSLADGVFQFARVAGDEIALVVVNGTDHSKRVALPAALRGLSFRDVLAGGTVSDAVEVEGRTTRIAVGRLRSALGAPKTTSRLVRFAVSDAHLGAGETLFVAGSTPELGNWDPNRASGPLVERAGQLTTEVQLPAGWVFAFKLIVRRSDGRVIWEPGEDRYLFVEDRAGPLEVKLSLRRG